MSAVADMHPQKRKIAARIAKLLRRAEREDGPEAQTASKMAHDLMSRHGIEVELHEFEEGPKPLVSERMVMFLKERNHEMWSQFLLQQLAPLYHCANRQEEVDAGWMFYVVGPPGQIEPAAIHFEYLRAKINTLGSALFRGAQNPMSFFQKPSLRASDGIHWGVMDGLFQTLNARHAANAATTPTSTDANVVKLEPMLALLPADHVAVRGDEVALCEPGEAPFGMGFAPPPDVDADQPPFWAWKIGLEAGKDHDPEPPPILFRPIAELSLPPWIQTALDKAEIRSVAQLTRMRPLAILDLGLSEDDVLAILEVLGDHGLGLAQDWGMS